MKFISKNKDLLNNAKEIVTILQKSGYTAYFAGGCVRDALLDRQVKDIDIATSATPEQLEKLFPAQSIGVGKSFGVMLIVKGQIAYDVATFRADGTYRDGRHPDEISFCEAEEDAKRRDFTINGIFYNPTTNEIIDFVNGKSDIQEKIVKAIGEPEKRFSEDRLRMLRAIRFSSVLNFKLDCPTLQAIKKQAQFIQEISIERISSEFTRMLCESEKPSTALELLSTTGLLQNFFPELIDLKSCEQNKQWHPEGNVWNHTIKMLDLTTSPRSPELIWSILLHDIAKPDCLIPETLATPRHAEIGAIKAERILRRFKIPTSQIQKIIAAVKYHMQFIALPQMKKSSLRKMLGRETITLELELHRVDCLASHGKLDIYEMANNHIATFANEPILPPPLLSGKDLINLGMKPGPEMGRILKQIYTEQLDGFPTTKEEALQKAKGLL